MQTLDFCANAYWALDRMDQSPLPLIQPFEFTVQFFQIQKHRVRARCIFFLQDLVELWGADVSLILLLHPNLRAGI